MSRRSHGQRRPVRHPLALAQEVGIVSAKLHLPMSSDTFGTPSQRTSASRADESSANLHNGGDDVSIHGRDDDGLGYIGEDDATDLRDREMESLEARIQGDVCVASPRLVRGSVEPVDVTAAV